MIILPTRRRLERSRDALYSHLESVISHASVSQVEGIMRKIHILNVKIKTYFVRDNEPKQIFEDW